MNKDDIITVGTISNYYGRVNVVVEKGKYYWCIEDWDGFPEDIEDWQEIPKELYDMLLKLER